MKREYDVAVTLSVMVMCVAGPARVAGEQSVARTLSVQQKTIKDVVPPTTSTSGVRDPLEVLAWVDRPDSTYARGEHVRMFVETSKDAYVTILNVDPAGDTTVLFPNEYQSDNLVRANRTVEVPDPSSRSRMIVTGTIGTELIKVIASTQPRPLFDTMQLSQAGPFRTVRTEPQRTARTLVVAMTEPPAVEATTPIASAAAIPTLGLASTEWAMCHQSIATIATPLPAIRRTRSLQVLRTERDGGSATCDEVDLSAAQGRLQRSIDGPVTREAVTRSLAVVPENAGDPGGPAEVSVMLRIEFGFNSAELTGQARRDLDSVAAALSGPQLADARLTLEGHTDATGTADYNLRLSQRRAEAVVGYLVQRGVAVERLRPAGFGEHRLLPQYVPTDDRQRRVEIVRTF